MNLEIICDLTKSKETQNQLCWTDSDHYDSTIKMPFKYNAYASLFIMVITFVLRSRYPKWWRHGKVYFNQWEQGTIRVVEFSNIWHICTSNVNDKENTIHFCFWKRFYLRGAIFPRCSVIPDFTLRIVRREAGIGHRFPCIGEQA